jgi:hypothetical protein
MIAGNGASQSQHLAGLFAEWQKGPSELSAWRTVRHTGQFRLNLRHFLPMQSASITVRGTAASFDRVVSGQTQLLIEPTATRFVLFHNFPRVGGHFLGRSARNHDHAVPSCRDDVSGDHQGTAHDDRAIDRFDFVAPRSNSASRFPQVQRNERLEGCFRVPFSNPAVEVTSFTMTGRIWYNGVRIEPVATSGCG